MPLPDGLASRQSKTSPSSEHPLHGRYDIWGDKQSTQTLKTEERYAAHVEDDSDTDSEMSPGGGLGGDLSDYPPPPRPHCLLSVTADYN